MIDKEYMKLYKFVLKFTVPIVIMMYCVHRLSDRSIPASEQDMKNKDPVGYKESMKQGNTMTTWKKIPNVDEEKKK
jgi:hypothetical protein